MITRWWKDQTLIPCRHVRQLSPPHSMCTIHAYHQVNHQKNHPKMKMIHYLPLHYSLPSSRVLLLCLHHLSSSPFLPLTNPSLDLKPSFEALFCWWRERRMLKFCNIVKQNLEYFERDSSCVGTWIVNWSEGRFIVLLGNEGKKNRQKRIRFFSNFENFESAFFWSYSGPNTGSANSIFLSWCWFLQG